MIYHIAHVYESNDAEERRRNTVARGSWERLYKKHKNVGRIHVPLVALQRNGNSVYGEKPFPFVKDLLDLGAKRIHEDDVLVLTNLDSVLTDDCFRRVENKPQYSHRVNFLKSLEGRNYSSTDLGLLEEEPFDGIDLIVIPVEWWLRHRDGVPDLMLGNEGWDWVFRFLIGGYDIRCGQPMFNHNRGKIDPPVVYHEDHSEPYWLRHRLTSKCNLHNRRLCNQWYHSQTDINFKLMLLREWPKLISDYGNEEKLKHERRGRRTDIGL
jgi:hypothetical protein